MDANQFLEKMKLIQNELIKLICNNASTEIFLKNFIILFNDLKIPERQHELKSILYLFVKIFENYYQHTDFFDKIAQLILFFRDEIKQTYSNFEIFNIFKTNKRILLLLIEEKILIVDKSISNIMLNVPNSSFKYHYYFYPEIKSFLNEKLRKEIEQRIPEKYEDIRRSGQNEKYICQLIRDDLIDEFISYVNKSNISLNMKIEQSNFETNLILIKNWTSLVEYAAFYGSIQIFKYLYKNKAELKPSIWLYSIHGRNAEIIHLLEENHIEFPGKSIKSCLLESVKCYNDEFYDYFMSNFSQDDQTDSFDYKINCLKFYNFNYIFPNDINESLFFDLCKYDYRYLVEILLKTKEIDVNAIIVLQ